MFQQDGTLIFILNIILFLDKNVLPDVFFFIEKRAYFEFSRIKNLS